MLEHVRPWCDLVVCRSTKSEEARLAKALQLATSGLFKPSDGLEPSTPSLPCDPNSSLWQPAATVSR
jgi:hypothetical protein